jgi:predicted transposase YbfD/YdcC
MRTGTVRLLGLGFLHARPAGATTVPATALSSIIAAVAALPADLPRPKPVDLLAALAEVPDPRKKRGIRHRLAAVLAVAICAVLGGSRSYAAIAEWGADLHAAERLRLGLGRREISERTIGRLLSRVDPEALSMVLCGWVAARCARPEHGPRQIAVDGKTARGARGPDGRAVHLLGALDVTSGAVLGQVPVDGKHNEITAFPQLLKGIDIAGALITADAMHTQRSHVEYLHSRGAHWLLIVKGNQPTRHTQLKALPWREVPITDRQTGKAHGRVENRTLQVAEIDAGIDFPHAKLAIRCIRVRKPRGARRQTETIYAITDLSWYQINPIQIADALRRHWHIENRLHWIRDVVFAEDLSQIRTGHGPAVMAALRNLAISMHRLTGADNIAERCRHVARNAVRAVELVT